MHKNITIIGSALLIGAIAITAIFQKNPDSDAPNIKLPPNAEALRFSNTMQWSYKEGRFREKPLIFLSDWERSITLPLPPENTSIETRQELAKLLGYKQLRTKEKVEEIFKQLEPESGAMVMGGRPILDYFDKEKFPNTAPVLSDAFNDVMIITIKLKERFDRVRPSFLEPAIDPVITIPGHPAYPSGHSTQMHFLAYFLGELAPERRDEFEREAYAIAFNREIAGVHYTSDTEAGKLLARQILMELKKNPRFAEGFRKARDDWKK
jgi:acid phosphatase (class A)